MEINLGGLPFDVDFHPSDSLVSAGLINGYLLLLLKVLAHKKSCRAAQFVNDGPAILSGSPDCSIFATDVETGAKIAHLEHAYTARINRIINLTESTLHQEMMRDVLRYGILGSNPVAVLLRSMRNTYQVQAQSEFSQDELLSVVIMKNGRKVICGTQTGILLLYSWGFFKDCSDRFVDLCPNPVDALLKLDEDRLITGSYNGLISLVGMLRNRIIQPIAEHSEYPVEWLAFSHAKKILGSISHDQILKLWDMDELLQGPSNVARNDAAASDNDSDGMGVDSDLPKPSKGVKSENAGNGQASSSSFNEFFADL